MRRADGRGGDSCCGDGGRLSRLRDAPLLHPAIRFSSLVLEPNLWANFAQCLETGARDDWGVPRWKRRAGGVRFPYSFAA